MLPTTNVKAPNPSPSTLLDLTSNDVDEMEILRDGLQKQCHMWQQKLRLQDWNVHVVLARLHEIPGRDAIGYITPVPERKDAHMTLLSPVDIPQVSSGFLKGEELNYDLTIVHELIHLHLWPFASNLTEAELMCEEQAVNAISRCIIAAYAHHSVLQDTPIVSQVPGHYL